MDKPAATSRAKELTQEYASFLDRAAALFPKVDQKLLLKILQFQTTYNDWEGNVLLKLVYPAGVDVEKKKEWIYDKYQRIPSVEQNKTIRFKAIRMYVEELYKIVAEDPEIQFVTGSVSLSPSEAYAS